jgi:hypothetical protein
MIMGIQKENNVACLAMAAVTVQQLSKYATVLEPLLCSSPHTTVEVLFDTGLIRGYIT